MRTALDLAAIVFLLPALLTGCVTSAYDGAILDAEDSMREGLYESALRDLDRARRTRSLDAEEVAEVGFLEASCLERRGRQSEAIARYREVAAAAPASELADRAEERVRDLESHDGLGRLAGP